MKYKRKIKKILINIKSFFNWKGIFSLAITLCLTLIIFPLITHIWIANNYKDKRFLDPEDVPEEKVAIVFGAGLWDDRPSPILSERVGTAVKLYKLGKVKKIIMSGDNRTANYDEPSAMIEMAMKGGVPEVVLQPDYAGRRTYDTCYRARHIFKLHSAILVTQDFHMDRALYTCNSLGIDSVGVVARTQGVDTKISDKIRDYFALMKAVWEININRPDNVVLGNTIDI